MKNNLSNVMPDSSERLLLLEVEMTEFSKGLYHYKSHLKLKRGFFWSFLKGMPFYNVPFMVRNYRRFGEPDYIFQGAVSNRVVPIYATFKDTINFQSDTHPALRYNKIIDSNKLVSKDLAELTFQEFAREMMNRQNVSWNILAAGYCLDVYFRIANERLDAKEDEQQKLGRDANNSTDFDPLDDFFDKTRNKP